MIPRSLAVASLALTLCSAGSAMASNDNFRLSGLVGYETTDDQRLYIYRTFSRELGVALSHKYTFAGDTTGLYGLDIAAEVSNVFVDTDRACPTGDDLGLNEDGVPLISTCYEDNGGNRNEWDPWRVMDYDHRLSGGKLYPIPGVRVRKGLPLSLEVGSALYLLPWSSQAALQGYGRWSLHEGFDTGKLRLIPDVALTVSGTRLVGNPEFDLGVVDWGVTFGYTVPVGGVALSRIGDLSVFGGFGRSYITSVPGDQLPDGLQCLAGWTGRPGKEVEWDAADASGCEGQAVFYSPEMRPFKGSFGFRVHNGPFQLGWSMELARLGVPSTTVRLGLYF